MSSFQDDRTMKKDRRVNTDDSGYSGEKKIQQKGETTKDRQKYPLQGRAEG